MTPLFSDTLWAAISPVYTAILDHGFVGELTRGTLPPDRFHYYLQQDALYLADFSRALVQLAVRADNPADRLLLIGFADSAIRVEQLLHEAYFTQYGISAAPAKQPACFAYTSYLLATTALEPLAVGAAAVLPCFWIYREVGRGIHSQSVANNPFQAWIDTYAGEAFDTSVRQMIDLTNRLAQRADASTRAQMSEAFAQASRLEWLFWNDAYTRQQWLI
ncbi:thiaminase II [Spirosoma luteolum]